MALQFTGHMFLRFNQTNDTADETRPEQVSNGGSFDQSKRRAQNRPGLLCIKYMTLEVKCQANITISLRIN